MRSAGYVQTGLSRPGSVLTALMLATMLAGFSTGVRADVRTEGAFGFPQASATVLCDTPELRVSMACDGTHWYVQAMWWNDGDKTLGLTSDGRKIGDNSSLVIDVDANGEDTKDVDRDYSLDPWPNLTGLHYSVCLGPGASTGLQKDSKGKGAIEYVKEGDKTFRVDSYLIPLAEIGRSEGEEVRFAFLGHSMVPDMTVNSIGYQPAESGRRYYSYHLPASDFHAWTIRPTQKNVFDLKKVPEGRSAEASKPIQIRSKPKIGTKVGEAGGPPEIVAQGWKNWTGENPPTLAGLKGKVIAVEFWATWCGPCIAGIPHLNELHKKHADEGLVLLSITDQNATVVTKFVEARDDMTYPIGMGSETFRAYGVTGIPHAFVIDRTGELIWAGHPANKAFDEHIERALAARSN